jgi:hypothetical protein
VVFSLLITTIPVAYSAATTVDFAPRQTVKLINETFSLNVTLSDVTNLNAWQTTISFNPEILNCTGILIPSDNIFAGYNTFNASVINNTIGQLTVFCALEGNTGVNGSGKLVTIEFKGKNIGVTSLNFLNLMQIRLDGTYLQDPNYNVIPAQFTIGIIEIVSGDFQLNMFDVTQDTTVFKVGIRTNSTITDFQFNQTFKELTYNATGLTGTTGGSIVTIPKDLLNDTLLILLDGIPTRIFISSLKTLTQNSTHCFTYFNYTHSTRNIKIRLTLPGDLTGDRKVDVKDVAIVAKSFGSTPGWGRWDPLADLDCNYKIDVKDVAFVAKNYGKILTSSN